MTAGEFAQVERGKLVLPDGGFVEVAVKSFKPGVFRTDAEVADFVAEALRLGSLRNL